MRSGIARWFFTLFATWLALPAVHAAELTGGAGDTVSATQRTVRALVEQALQADAAADLGARGQLLEQALRTAPDAASAHWHLGQVRYQGKWMSLDAASERAAQDKLLADYREMRRTYPDGIEAQKVMARWCAKHGLAMETRAHATRWLESDPSDTEALKLLDLTWHEGLLLSRAQIAARQARAAAARQALKAWQPRVAALREQLDSGSSEQRAQAGEALRRIDDPAAVGALELVLGKRPEHAARLIQALGNLPGAEATDALLRHALLTRSADVRQAACEQLRQRPLHSYVPRLVGALAKPLEARFAVDQDEAGIRFRSTLRREDAVSSREVSRQTEVGLVMNPNLADIVGSAYSSAMKWSVRAEKAARTSSRTSAQFNEPIFRVLEATTGQQLPHDADSWWTWWQEYNELTLVDKPTFSTTYTQPVDVPYQPYLPPEIPIYQHMRCISCFAKGTLVQTLGGPLAIEQVQVGDRVAAQDPLTGELDYQPVLGTTHGNTTSSIVISLAGERIEATRGHVFWVSGKGWRMARDLEPGNRLHTAIGWSDVQQVTHSELSETFNLVVADFHTYFVGADRILSHDTTMLQPTTAKVPGLREQ